MKKAVKIIYGLFLFLCASNANAQKFFNLSADEVKIDSILPYFTYTRQLTGNYSDSIYSAKILYPEFADMTTEEIANYKKLSQASLPTLPDISQTIISDRKRQSLQLGFMPLVYRNGKYQILVSFMLKIDVSATKQASNIQKTSALTRITTKSERYAAHSVLATGTWAKIRIPSSGIYQLTSSLIKKAGFKDLNKIKVYGYGGALQNETLNENDLIKYDDLKEIPICTYNGKRLFHAQGPVSWENISAEKRTRNPYSDYGYYFITESNDNTADIDSATFINTFYPSADDYHSLYEKDGYSWFYGGRNLFDTENIKTDSPKTFVFTNDAKAKTAILSANVTAGNETTFTISINGKLLGSQTITLEEYDKAEQSTISYKTDNLKASDTITIAVTNGGPAKLDYISFAYDTQRPAPSLSSTNIPTPEYVYNITNQDHHADSQADMIIIIPTSQKLLAQAKRLKAFHESHDSLKVNIVPADELYNEFSSGTPDANAYRRYIKMLYDRAESDNEMPKYLLLMGDGSFDNRMITSDLKNESPDDYLLCFESENSFNEINCYVDDNWYGLLDDGEGSNPRNRDMADIAIGRFPVTTAEEAKIMVDKTINYVNNSNAGDWQNTIMFMGDDGNENIHMHDLNEVADYISSEHPEFITKKVIWDAYQRVISSDGASYPEATKLIKQQQQKGALIMDYAGHGSQNQMSHEKVLMLSDFKNFRNTNLPLWVTASCDIMPFDMPMETIGESAVLNSKGGAVAFFGTTRTVYATYNKQINKAFLKYALSTVDGMRVTIGEAQRLAKNYMITSGLDRTNNKLQYSLLGDPAIALNIPTPKIIIDSINNETVSASNLAQMKAGQLITVKGHINDNNFNGVISATVRDAKEKITCRRNDETSADTAFVFSDRTKNIFNGSSPVNNSRFSFSFAVPKDISYSNQTGLINLFAVNNDNTQTLNGYNEDFTIGGDTLAKNDSIGPSIYCYLNSTSFADGGKVNATPYFFAQISDKNGLNVTGNSIGHDLELIIDNETSKTYILNENFTYDFSSYTSGSTYYSLPELSEGMHTLKFRAWDIYNNSSTAELKFNVVKGLEPTIFNISCTNNPASTNTTFVITNDRIASDVDICIDVFDMSGRILWTHKESGSSTSNTYTVNWNLTTDTGAAIQTGVYLYRVRLSSDGSSKASKAKKLIIIHK